METGAGDRLRVLVPLDGSSLAEQAIPYAAALAGPDEEILLLHVAPELKQRRDDHGALLPMTETDLSRYDHHLRETVTVAAGHWRPVAPRVAVEVVYGDPAEEILRVTDEQHPDLIAMASHGRGALGRWRFGSVADRIARSAPVPVLIIRPQDAQAEIGPAPIHRFIVPLDGSALAAQALPVAARLARRTQRPVLLVRVLSAVLESWVPLPGVNVATPDPTGREIALAAERNAVRRLEAAEAQLTAAGVAAASLVEVGPVVERIMDVAKHGDVIVLASHGESGLRRWALGSVAEKLIRLADSPVVVVRAYEETG